MSTAASRTRWTDERLAAQNKHLASRSPNEILQWGLDTFTPDIVQATGFGPSGVVIMHLLAQLRPGTTVFYLDTDLLFPETYELCADLADRLSVTIERVHGGVSLAEQADEAGPELWRRQPDRCCYLRKVRPLRRFLSDKRAWITGLRRDQSAQRAETPVVTWDAQHGLVKLNPLAYWARKQVWRYIHDHDLPYNPLHDAGYPSLGCMPCTAPADPNHGERAGRWPDAEKTECGLHT